MQKLFSTQELHPRDKFDFWHDVACKSIVDHSSRPQSRREFWAELEHGSFADIDLILFENSPMEISHTKRHVASSNNDHLFICRQITGALALEQNARAIMVCYPESGLVNRLVSASQMELRDGETSQPGRDHCQAA